MTMRYVETTTIVRIDENGRLTRKRKTTYGESWGGSTYEYNRIRPLSADEYFTRKAYDCTNRSSMDRIYDSYREYRSLEEWD